jgi:hypothetical protein
VCRQSISPDLLRSRAPSPVSSTTRNTGNTLQTKWHSHLTKQEGDDGSTLLEATTIHLTHNSNSNATKTSTSSSNPTSLANECKPSSSLLRGDIDSPLMDRQPPRHVGAISQGKRQLYRRRLMAQDPGSSEPRSFSSPRLWLRLGLPLPVAS